MIADNFWEHCDQSGGRDACWPWRRARNFYGYGTVWYCGANKYAHRHAFELTKSQIPSGLIVMHSCDNRDCVNPKHLSVGTVADNNHDRDIKGRGRGGRPPKQRNST